MVKIRLPVVLVVAAIAVSAASIGCAHNPKKSNAPVIASLGRTQCFGTCPVYEVKVHADGLVVYDGKDFVKLKGRHTAKLDERKLAELHQAFKRAGYFELLDAYDDENIVDNSWANTSYTKDGKTKSVRHYQSDASAPATLGDLEEQIDEIVETSRWVGTRDERDELERKWMK